MQDKMFFGRECYKCSEILSRMLGEDSVQSKASSRWLQPFIRAYIYLFGLPNVGYQLRALYFRKYIKPFRFNKALDAGCALGLCSFYLAKKHALAKIDACDCDLTLIEAAKGMLSQLNLSNVNIFQADLTELSEKDKYELIICIDVIEHIEDDKSVINNLHRALKDNGILYLTTPHQRHTKRYFKNLKYESRGHVRAGYTEETLTNLLKENGFTTQKVRNVWGFWGECCEELFMLAILRLPLPFAALVFPLLSVISRLDTISRNRNGYGLLVIAQKRDSQGGARSETARISTPG